jgi:hypothetical protein
MRNVLSQSDIFLVIMSGRFTHQAKRACGAGAAKVDYWEKRQHSRRECRENMARLMHTEILCPGPMQAGLRHEP